MRVLACLQAGTSDMLAWSRDLRLLMSSFWRFSASAWALAAACMHVHCLLLC